MSDFDEATLNNLKKLCRMELAPAEVEELKKNIQRVLDYVEQLNEIDTEGVKPCAHVLELMLKNIMRKDEVKNLLSREAFLANAPDQIGAMIKVPPVLKETS